MLSSRRLAKTRPGFILIELLTVLFIISSLVLLLIPNLRWSVYKTQLTGCQMNLKQLSTATQLYANDNDDRYPEKLEDITPHYYREIPRCPAVDKDTYSEGYERTDNFRNYTIYCKGKNHEVMKLKENEPYWSNEEGLKP